MFLIVKFVAVVAVAVDVDVDVDVVVMRSLGIMADSCTRPKVG